MPSTTSTPLPPPSSSRLPSDYFHLPSNHIQDRIWMLQIAQREHTMTKPPMNGVALVLPEPLPQEMVILGPAFSNGGHHPDEDDEDDKARMLPDKTKALPTLSSNNNMTSLLCILPTWPNQLFRKRRRVKPAVVTDTSTVRLLEEASHGEWS